MTEYKAVDVPCWPCPKTEEPDLTIDDFSQFINFDPTPLPKNMTVSNDDEDLTVTEWNSSVPYTLTTMSQFGF